MHRLPWLLCVVIFPIEVVNQYLTGYRFNHTLVEAVKHAYILLFKQRR